MKFDLIVMGGSSSAAEAIARVLAELPADFPACIAIVLAAEDRPRNMADILGRRTAMRVAYAQPGERLRKGAVFLAPPGVHLVVGPGPDFTLEVQDGPRVQHARPSADRLFQSAAQALGSRVIGVVLSGGDGDGAAGLRSIKAAGGVTVTQSPADASRPHMPSHAILHDSPDHVVLTEELGPLLQALVEARRR